MNPKLFIVNQFDRPCERLIAEQVGDELFYINPELREEWQHWPMRMDEATPLEAFGLTIHIENGVLEGVLHPHLPRTATYPDGKPRSWQGSSNFSFKLPERSAREVEV